MKDNRKNWITQPNCNTSHTKLYRDTSFKLERASLAKFLSLSRNDCCGKYRYHHQTYQSLILLVTVASSHSISPNICPSIHGLINLRHVINIGIERQNELASTIISSIVIRNYIKVQCHCRNSGICQVTVSQFFSWFADGAFIGKVFAANKVLLLLHCIKPFKEIIDRVIGIL